MADPDGDPGDPGLRFDGLRAVVTGAGRGLGRVYAESLAQRGASVLVNDIGVSADADVYAALDGDAAIFGADARVADVAARVADLIRQTGATAAASTADISRPDGARTLVETAVTDLGGIDIVINNAGVIPYAPIDQTTYEQFNQTIAVHVGGAFNLTKEAWPLLCASRNARNSEHLLHRGSPRRDSGPYRLLGCQGRNVGADAQHSGRRRERLHPGQCPPPWSDNPSQCGHSPFRRVATGTEKPGYDSGGRLVARAPQL